MTKKKIEKTEKGITLSDIRLMIDSGVDRAYTQRVKTDFDNNLLQLNNEIKEIKKTTDEIKQVLIGDTEYGSTEGLVQQVKANTRFRERFVWTMTVAVAIGGIVWTIIQMLLAKLFDKIT
jgi:hypothetical protein